MLTSLQAVRDSLSARDLILISIPSEATMASTYDGIAKLLEKEVMPWINTIRSGDTKMVPVAIVLRKLKANDEKKESNVLAELEKIEQKFNSNTLRYGKVHLFSLHNVVRYSSSTGFHYRFTKFGVLFCRIQAIIQVLPKAMGSR